MFERTFKAMCLALKQFEYSFGVCVIQLNYMRICREWPWPLQAFVSLPLTVKNWGMFSTAWMYQCYIWILMQCACLETFWILLSSVCNLNLPYSYAQLQEEIRTAKVLSCSGLAMHPKHLFHCLLIVGESFLQHECIIISTYCISIQLQCARLWNILNIWILLSVCNPTLPDVQLQEAIRTARGFLTQLDPR